MQRMVTALDRFIAADKPFRKAARRQRVEQLRQSLSDADSTPGEQFRQILEVYRQEAAYGRNIGAYRGEVTVDGVRRTVEFLRIGRIAFLYQTPDQRHQGFWHPEKSAWVALGERYRDPIRRGLRIAKERTAPAMIRVPLAGLEGIR